MSTLTKKKMTPAQQTKLLNYVDIGLKWIKGDIAFDEVVKVFGDPEFHSDQLGKIEYSWFPEKIMTVSFIFDRGNLVDGKPGIDTFNIRMSDDVHTSIPYEHFDSLGMKRIVRGERMDSVRTEKSDFFRPDGVIEFSGGLPKNYVSFGWRLPMPEDSPYDIRAGFGYLGEWIDQKKEMDFSNLRNAVDLRDVTISRFYLLPNELQQRDAARRQKSG
ncbi:hypothetical protein [Paraburkholderia sp. J67]|uniref:hypothetical protein n=1 Tax=Paraburkholderia sp. J67 TaxID=2805435 RepID=UPI002ABDAA38|nr:hypothetical protein [Paraburkholderia sp. J67]